MFLDGQIYENLCKEANSAAIEFLVPVKSATISKTKSSARIPKIFLKNVPKFDFGGRKSEASPYGFRGGKTKILNTVN